jgi:hypothetical protein
MVARMARIITLVPVVTSLVAFISEVTRSGGWWVLALDRASYVLVVLAVVAALLAKRRASGLVFGAQALAALTALVFMALALVKFYDAIPAFGVNFGAGQPWANEAQLLAAAALAFGLTLERRRDTVTVAGLLVSIGIALGCAVYAITQKSSYEAFMWWSIAIVAAFLAAAAAAGLERDGIVTLGAPVENGEPASDPGIE